jgi:hypothetical protein
MQPPTISSHDIQSLCGFVACLDRSAEAGKTLKPPSRQECVPLGGPRRRRSRGPAFVALRLRGLSGPFGGSRKTLKPPSRQAAKNALRRAVPTDRWRRGSAFVALRLCGLSGPFGGSRENLEAAKPPSREECVPPGDPRRRRRRGSAFVALRLVRTVRRKKGKP